MKSRTTLQRDQAKVSTTIIKIIMRVTRRNLRILPWLYAAQDNPRETTSEKMNPIQIKISLFFEARHYQGDYYTITVGKCEKKKKKYL